MTDKRIQIMNPHFLNKQQRGTQIMAGNLQLEGVLRANNQTVRGALTLKNQAEESYHAVRADRTIRGGTGIDGGGDLTSNRILAINTSWMDDNYVNRKDGSTITGELTLNSNSFKSYLNLQRDSVSSWLVTPTTRASDGLAILASDDSFGFYFGGDQEFYIGDRNNRAWHQNNFNPADKADLDNPSFSNHILVGDEIRLTSSGGSGYVQAGSESSPKGSLVLSRYKTTSNMEALDILADQTNVSDSLSVNGTATFTSYPYPVVIEDGWVEFGAEQGSYSKFIATSGDNYSAGGGKLLIGNTTNSPDALLAIQQDNRVGIRNVNPDALLHVDNSGSTAPPFYVDLGDYPGTQTLFNHTGGQNHQPFRMVKSNDTSTSSSYRVLGVGRDVNGEGRGSMYSIDMKNSAGNWTSYGGIGAHIASNSSGAERGTVTIYTTDGGSERSDKVTVHHSGRVGIGDDNPDEKLTVAGTIKSHVAGELVLENDTWGSLRQGAFTDDLDRSVSTRDMALSTRYNGSSASRSVNQIWNDAGGTVFWTGSNDGNREIFRLHSDGDLDIGGSEIKVENGSNDHQSIYLKRDTGHSWRISNSGNLVFEGGDSVASKERLRIDTTGDIGVGGIEPTHDYMMEFAQTGTPGEVNPTIGLRGVTGNDGENENGGAGIQFRTSTSSGFGPIIAGIRRSGGNGDFVIHTGGNSPSERLRVDDGGNVGIGISSPSDKLHVNGGAQFESGIHIRGEDSDYTLLRFERHNQGSYDASWNIGLVYGQFTLGPYSVSQTSNRLFVINQNHNIGINRPNGTNNADSELHVGGRTESDDGFKTGNYEIVHNSSEDSLDIMYVG